MAYKKDLGDLEDYDGEDHPGHALLLDTNNYS
jgi:Ca2+-transporting ATPase